MLEMERGDLCDIGRMILGRRVGIRGEDLV